MILATERDLACKKSVKLHRFVFIFVSTNFLIHIASPFSSLSDVASLRSVGGCMFSLITHLQQWLIANPWTGEGATPPSNELTVRDIPALEQTRLKV